MKENEENKRLFRLAKRVLSSRRGMTEAQAHRYIQKLAMDCCVTKYTAALLVLEVTCDTPTADDR